MVKLKRVMGTLAHTLEKLFPLILLRRVKQIFLVHPMASAHEIHLPDGKEVQSLIA